MTRWRCVVLCSLAVAVGFSRPMLAEQDRPQRKGPADASETTASEKALADAFSEFARDPGKEDYLTVRKLVISDPRYNPYSDDLRQLGRLQAAGKHDELKKKANAALPNLILSPRFHLIMGNAAKQRGENELAVIERRMAVACLKGILTTGDGSEESPYLVIRTSDEYDVLGYLDKESKSQGLVFKGDRKLDVLECTDGSLVRFDITDAFAQLGKRSQRDRKAKQPKPAP